MDSRAREPHSPTSLQEKGLIFIFKNVWTKLPLELEKNPLEKWVQSNLKDWIPFPFLKPNMVSLMVGFPCFQRASAPPEFCIARGHCWLPLAYCVSPFIPSNPEIWFGPCIFLGQTMLCVTKQPMGPIAWCQVPALVQLTGGEGESHCEGSCQPWGHREGSLPWCVGKDSTLQLDPAIMGLFLYLNFQMSDLLWVGG